MTNYDSIKDAETALISSGVFEMFSEEQLEAAAEWMYRNDATAEQAAEYFQVI